MSEAAHAATNEGRGLARNTLLLGAGHALALALGFVTTLIVTDLLGEDGYGLFLGAQRFVAFFLVIARFGLDPLLVRAIASSRDEPGNLLGTVLVLRLGLGLVFFAVVAGVAMISGYLPDYRWLLFAVAGMELVGAFATVFTALCEGRERMGRSAAVTVVRSFVTFNGIVVVTLLGGGLTAIVMAYLTGRCFQLLGAVLLTPGAAPRLRLRVRREQLPPIVIEAVPFVVVGLAYMALRSFDVMILTRFSSIPEASRYGAALNFSDVLLTLPVLIQRALLPALSRLHVGGAGSEVAHDTVVALSAVLIPAAVGLALLADAAVALYPSGEFGAAAPVLRVLAVALLFQGPTTVCATLLTGAGRVWRIVGCYAMALPVQVALSLHLVAPFGALGVAIATVSAHAVLAFLLILVAGPLGLRFPVLPLLRHAAAAVLMGAVVLATRHLFLAVPVVLGSLAYAAVLLTITPTDAPERLLIVALVGRARRGWRHG